MTKGSHLLVASLCGGVALLSACRKQEGTATQPPEKTDTIALFPVNVGGKYGFINSAGSLVIPAQFDKAGPDFSEGLAAVCVGRCSFVEQVWQGNWGYIDKTGRFAITPQFSSAGQFSRGLADASTEEQTLYGDRSHCGYIDHTGKLVIAIQFSSCRPFDNAGMAAVAVGFGDDSRMGFIDTAGHFLINPQFYLVVRDFRYGLAEVYPNKDTPYGDTSYIDRSGKYVWRPPQQSSNVR
jgi:hypothetical protein